MVESRRLFVGGLTEGVKEEELRERFNKFGQISSINIRHRHFPDGTHQNSFAHLDINVTEPDLQKCIQIYNKTKWKGRELHLQLAKESFLDRLKKERESPADEVPVKKKRSKSADSVTILPPKPLIIPGAKPGAEVPGEKDWIVAKYCEVLPVVKMRSRDKKKVVKIDPSKFVHNMKRFDHKKNEKNAADRDVQSDRLTWQMDNNESEINKRMKGEFPAYTPPPRKKKPLPVMVPRQINRPDEGLEVVPIKNAVDVLPKLGQLRSEDNSESAYDSADSEDTDELISCSKPAEKEIQTKSPITLKNKKKSPVKNLKSAVTKTTPSSEIDKNSKICVDPSPGHPVISRPIGIQESDGDSDDTDDIILSAKGRQTNSSPVITTSKTQCNIKPSTTPNVANMTPNAVDEFSSGFDDVQNVKYPHKSQRYDDYEEDLLDIIERTGRVPKYILSQKVPSSSISQNDRDSFAKHVQNKGKVGVGVHELVNLPSSNSVKHKEKEVTMKLRKQPRSNPKDENEEGESQRNLLISRKRIHPDNSSVDVDDCSESSSSEDLSEDKQSKSAITKTKKPKSSHILTKNLAKDGSVSSSSESSDSEAEKESLPNNKNAERIVGRKSIDRSSESSTKNSDHESDTENVKSHHLKEKSGDNKVKDCDSEISSSSSLDSSDEEDSDIGMSSEKVKTNNLRLKGKEVTESSDSSSDEGDDDMSDKSENDSSDSESCDHENRSKTTEAQIDSDSESSASSSSDSSSEESSVAGSSLQTQSSSSRNKTTTKENVKVQHSDDEDDESSSDSSESSLLETNRKVTPSSLTKETENSNKKSNVKPRDIQASVDKNNKQTHQSIDEKNALANQRRLDSLKQRQAEKNTQKLMLQTALKTVDKASPSKHHVIFSSDSESDPDEAVSMDTTTKKPAVADADEGPARLFDSSDDEDDSDNEEKDADRFRFKPQFQGKAGERLMNLQSQYKSDDRFRLDERFLDEAKDDDSSRTHQVAAEHDMAAEKARQMEVLKSLVGAKAAAIKKKDKDKNSFKSLSLIHYDPDREDHSHFEIKTQPKEKTKKAKPSKLEDTEKTVESTPLPEVSREHFYEVSTSLKSLFGQSSQQHFGFLNPASHDEADGQQSGLAVRESIKPSTVSTGSSIFPWQDKFTYDTSDEEEAETEGPLVASDPLETTIAAPKHTFFFSEQDPRIKEGVEFFHRTEDINDIRTKWVEKRPELVESYKMRRKRAFRKSNAANFKKKKT